MALDGMMLHHVVNELKTVALGSRVYQIYQPNRDEIIIVLRTQNGNKRLLLSSRANSPRLHFTDYAVENPATPPMLCMLMRKRLGGGKLIDIRQLGLDRVVFFDFECTNELGDKVKITLVVEIMGKYSNIIMTDENGVIIDALKRVDMTMSSKRMVLPNLKYEIPSSQDKANILLAKADEVAQKILNEGRTKALNKAILNCVQGISPIVCREIEDSVCENKELLQEKIKELSHIVLGSKGTPIMLYYKGENKPFDISFININQYGSMVETKIFESFSKLLDSFYIERDSTDRMKVKSADLMRILNNRTSRLSNKINNQSQELKACADREQLRIKGDLLHANLYRIERGAEFVIVENFYDENNEKLKITLNPAISPAQNAQKFYKDYNKAKTAQHILTEQIKKAEQELVYIDSLKDLLSRITTEKELSQIRLEFIEQGYIKGQKDNNKKPQQLPPLEYETSEGFKVLVGRNNKQNDQLTLKTAKNKDMWFHTKNIPGSHTILVTEGKKITDTAILEAAQIAAYHSKARESHNVPVDYTYIKYVSKPNGAKPGMVVFVKNKTVYVTPKVPN